MDLHQFDLLAERLEELLLRWQKVVRQNEELVLERGELLARLQASEREIESLRQERDMVRSRVNGLISRLDESSVA
jgi:cell division protein FtsB